MIKRKAAMPPKPPKPLSKNEILKRHYAGLPLTDEEYAIYRAWQDKKTEQARERRHRIKESQPPKPPKVKRATQKEIMSGIIARKNAGEALTPEEQTAYALYREERNAKHKKWRGAKAADKPIKLSIEQIKERRKLELPLTPEEAEALDSWLEKKRVYNREWRDKNSDYHKEWNRRKRAETAQAVGL